MQLKLKPISKKKGQVSGLSSSILSLGVAAIVLVLVLVITQELRDTQTAGTEAYNAANDTVVGIGTFGDFWTIIVLAIVAAIVIGIIFGAFGGLTGGGKSKGKR
jgi:hypothetical protein